MPSCWQSKAGRSGPFITSAGGQLQLCLTNVEEAYCDLLGRDSDASKEAAVPGLKDRINYANQCRRQVQQKYPFTDAERKAFDAIDEVPDSLDNMPVEPAEDDMIIIAGLGNQLHKMSSTRQTLPSWAWTTTCKWRFGRISASRYKQLPLEEVVEYMNQHGKETTRCKDCWRGLDLGAVCLVSL